MPQVAICPEWLQPGRLELSCEHLVMRTLFLALCRLVIINYKYYLSWRYACVRSFLAPMHWSLR